MTAVGAAGALQRTDGRGNHLEAGTAAEPTGAQIAWDNADDWWASAARRALTWLAELQQPFTCTDIADLGVPDPDHPNRWGGLMQAGVKSGLVKSIGYMTSTKPSRHHSVVRVWIGI